jgi:fatty-acyl-CoA synthase
MADGRRVGPLSEWTPDRAGEVVQESVPQVLARQLPAYGDRPFVYWPQGDGLAQLTYRELAGQATRVAQAIAGATSKGDRVAVWALNSPRWVVLEFASALAGTILVPFNTLWTDAEAEHAVAVSTPSIIFAGPGRAGESLAPRAAAVAAGATVVDLADVDSWSASVEPGELPAVEHDDPFLIQFTSGTTGRSKGAVLSHRVAVNAAYQRNRCEVIVENDAYLNQVPYHHVGGTCSVILGALVDGGAIFALEKWDPDQVIKIMRTGLPTRLGGVPTMIIDLLNRLGEDGRDFTYASISIGGTKVPEALIHRVEDVFGAPVDVTFAQSESPAITSTIAGVDEPHVIAATVGRPLPAVHLKIVTPATDEIVPLGTVGEILVRSPFVMDGYWDNPEQTAATITPDGFLRTGDLGSMDERGNLTFQGRARDVIIRGGENIYPAEIEEILDEHPAILSAIVVGIDDDRLGEQPVAVVIRAPGRQVTGAELADYLKDRVASFKTPVAWRFVGSFPLTASGKVRRFIVRDETNARLPSRADAPETDAP